MSDETSVSRPVLVTIIGVLYLITGLIPVIVGALFCFGTIAVPDIPDFNLTVAASTLGISMIVSGLISVIVGVGLLKGWKIMWYLGVFFTALGIIGSILMILALVGIVTLIIDALIMYYLFRPGVKAFFNI